MFFNTLTNSFKNPKMAHYCDLDMARDIQTVFDMGPCPHSGLIEAGRLRIFYFMLLNQAYGASPHRAMHRQISAMAA